MAKVKIIQEPISRYTNNLDRGRGPLTGDQDNYGLYTTPYIGGTVNNQSEVNTVEPKVDRKDATIEAEKGEMIIAGDLSTLKKIIGKKHSEGGTPINPDKGDYIVSNYLKPNPGITKSLGLSEPGKKDTWANYLSSLVDPKDYNTMTNNMDKDAKGKDVDPYDLNRAKIQVPDYQNIMGKIALGNELTKAMRGEQYSIPQVAEPALQQLQQAPRQPNTNPDYKMKLGGFIPKYDNGGDVNPYTRSNTRAGGITPTGQSSFANGDYNKYLNIWEQYIPGISKMSNADMQNAVYGYQLKNNPTAVRDMWKQYGMTSKGMSSGDKYLTSIGGKLNNLTDSQLKSYQPQYADGLAGARTLGLMSRIPLSRPAPDVQTSTRIPSLATPGINPDAKPSTVYPNQQAAYDTVYHAANLPDKYKDREPNAPFFAMDALALGMAAANRPKTYFPWAEKVNPAYINPVFDTPDYNPYLASQATNNDLLQAVSDPNTARANASYQPNLIQGFIQENQRVKGNNLNTAMSTQQYNNQLYNNSQYQNAQIDTNLYDKTIASLEERDQAKQLYKNNLFGAANNMVNNRAKNQLLQLQYPQYSIDEFGNYHYIPNKDNQFNASRQYNPVEAYMQAMDQVMNKYPDAGIRESYANQLGKYFLGSNDEARYDGQEKLLKRTTKGNIPGLS